MKKEKKIDLILNKIKILVQIMNLILMIKVNKH